MPETKDARGTKTVLSDSQVRNQPSPLAAGATPAQLAAQARYISGRIAQWLEVEPIPYEDLRAVWGSVSEVYGVSLGRGEGASAIYEKNLLEYVKEDVGTITVARDPGWPDLIGVLAHEITHAYLLRHTRGHTSWVHEGFANYIPTVLGYTQFAEHLQRSEDTVGDPVADEYGPAARFIAWMDQIHPGTAKVWAREIYTGLINDLEGAEKLTKVPLPVLLAAYEEDPYLENAGGPMGRFLKQRWQYAPIGRRVFDAAIQRAPMYLERFMRISAINQDLIDNGIPFRAQGVTRRGPIWYEKIPEPPRTQTRGGGQVTVRRPEPEPESVIPSPQEVAIRRGSLR